MTSAGTAALSCKAYGHYPKDIEVTWWRGGQAIAEEDMLRVTLPYPDQTYLSVSSFNVTPIIGERYTCVVQHSSLQGALIQHWGNYKWGRITNDLYQSWGGAIPPMTPMIGGGLFLH